MSEKTKTSIGCVGKSILSIEPLFSMVDGLVLIHRHIRTHRQSSKKGVRWPKLRKVGHLSGFLRHYLLSARKLSGTPDLLICGAAQTSKNTVEQIERLLFPHWMTMYGVSYRGFMAILRIYIGRWHMCTVFTRKYSMDQEERGFTEALVNIGHHRKECRQ